MGASRRLRRTTRSGEDFSGRSARGALGALVMLAVLSGRGAARAQGRPDVRGAPAASAGCTLVRERALATGTRALDPRHPLSIAATATGALVVFRARGTDELVVVRVDDGLARVADDRVVAGPVIAFALTSAPGGAALAAVERGTRGGRDVYDEVILARLDTAGEARNVPRVLARVQRCDGVSILVNELGAMVAWGTADGPASATVVTDARGVPVGSVRTVVPASSPTLASFAGGGRFAMMTRSDAGASLSLLDGSGAAVDGVARGGVPVAIVGASSTVLSFAMNGDALTLARWSPGSAPVESVLVLPRGVSPVARLVHATSDRTTALALFDDPSGREHLVRVSPDGATARLATLTGARGALAPSLDAGAFFLAAHGPDGGLSLQRWTCPGVPSPVAVAASSPSPDGGAPLIDPARATPATTPR
jgi:hypothetical protein